MTHHTLKLHKPWFEAKLAGLKPWEIRQCMDRRFQVDDTVTFREMDGDRETGRTIGPCRITYLMLGDSHQTWPLNQNCTALLENGLCIFTHGDTVDAALEGA